MLSVIESDPPRGGFSVLAWYVYIIRSESTGTYYVGYTHDLDLRLVHHNDGWTRSTKGRGPWKLVYSECFKEKKEALKREKAIKKMKSKSYLDRLIAHAGGRPDPSM